MTRNYLSKFICKKHLEVINAIGIKNASLLNNKIFIGFSIFPLTFSFTSELLVRRIRWQ